MTDKNSNRKIEGFKKFTDIKSSPKVEELNLDCQPKSDADLPANPNIPKPTIKVERPISDENISKKKSIPTKDEDDSNISENVKTFGKIAKFPKGVKASKCYNFLENVKVSKKSIWYIMVEKMSTKDGECLQMIKYNHKEGVDLNKFVSDLKYYYINKYKSNIKLCESISKIKVDGNDKYSIISSIPTVEIEGKKVITRITEDLIKLLSK